MSNTTFMARKTTPAGVAPPGQRLDRDAEYGFPEVAAVQACAKQCCLGEDSKRALKKVDDDDNEKYHKRYRQKRSQKKLRQVLLLLTFSLCLLVFTVYQVTRRPGFRLARRSDGLPPHHAVSWDGQPRHHGHGRPKQQQQQQQHRGERDKYDDRMYDDQRPPARQEETPLERNGRRDLDDAVRKQYARDPSQGWHPGQRAGRGGRGQGRGWGWGGNQQQQDDGDDGDDDKTKEKSSPQDKISTMKRRKLELEELNERILDNTNTSIRWADMRDVPALPGWEETKVRRNLLHNARNRHGPNRAPNEHKGVLRQFYQVHRPEHTKMAWETEFDAIEDKELTARADYVDYVKHAYKYPEKLMEPPKLGNYPRVRSYKEIQTIWPQDNLDNPPEVLEEDLIHFDWNIPADMEAAVKFREAKLPFKVVNVPELLAASEKWTDEYIAANFDGGGMFDKHWGSSGQQSNGRCNEGPDNFFAFFNRGLWDVEDLGIPPTRDNDWTFRKWAKHCHYADRVGLHPNRPHYYWQSGVPREERLQPESQWTFVSRDLPSFASKEENFVVFHPEHQKGIQCRFGERGITAANHYDSGRNMIGMITGAKRYILSPPRACKKLGIVSSKGHSSFRHSMLNYGHIALIESHHDTMPTEEREWLEMVGTAEAVSTVVKSGEILYVPTGWFHYITSLQKSAQCNVRSGPDMTGDAYWGGATDIQEDCFPHE